MRLLILSVWLAVVLTAGGCTGTTPIKNVRLPPVTTIEGTITHLDQDGFTLADDSGSIFVRARLPDDRRPNVSLQEKVRVYGNLQGGQERVFDGYVIKKPNGEQIIVTNPTPHFGFIIQGSFH
ncbi:hypothetical protein M6I34_09910 [Burkholderiaceae bacterium FT117]|uniref:hypothetical protein n=1 Tax=Zeimonas sediminis TaxID=2944268 RepID=UPI002343003B|nr:hypothetical protein [Zeimonas sediminis]MCM5570820.1 hypothetical protein [Zeimonas sediminis]